MKRNLAYLLLLVAALAGGGIGYLAAPALARTNDIVRTAAQEWRRMQAGDAALPPSPNAWLRSDGFRQTGGADRDALFARARRIVNQFRLGALLLGLWWGLAVGLKVFTLSRPDRRTEFEVDHAWCVSCGRCYRWCPRERLRLKGGKATG